MSGEPWSPCNEEANNYLAAQEEKRAAERRLKRRIAGKLCWQAADLQIELAQRGKDNFTVTYGQQVLVNLPYGAATLELGKSIMHALACDGKLDNRMKGEE